MSRFPSYRRFRGGPLSVCLLIGALSMGLFGCGAELGAETETPSESVAEAAADSPMEHAAKHLDPKYVCPMHPQIIRDEEGTCPICGMDLVKKLMDPLTGKYPEVALTSAVVQTLGVRTAAVERGTLWKYIETLGRIAYDETRLAHVHPRAAGWIESLSLRAEGEPVRAGQELAELYAPAILNAQVDFLLAQDRNAADRRRVSEDKARNILRLLDVPDDVISAIQRDGEARNRVPIRAPIDGIVTQMMARDGMYVTESSEMFTIADLSQVWVMVDIYESQIDWLAEGLSAEMRVPARPGRTWEGKVDYLYPELDPVSRTLQVRLVFENPDLALKPNMFADVVIYGGPKREVLKIPAEALIVTGEREAVVTVLGDGRFQPVDVVTGMQRGDEVEILSGLDEGDEIVVSGQFLIDSESNLQASFRRMSGVGGSGASDEDDAGDTGGGMTAGGSHAHH
ncbi:efflux RND transporter periplasmic adaptor subunit [Lamprobacter modestohalophilus]|uniref:efflux RND transporter periplasmic adaptor subunit n=1 Tax=Lamprobacter modestohalophilus TaxID=1064514 RepID=UPI002ADEABB5|nr:efflux RND transporter periplasmic adaptor subunit [Lamprobacter modestohalophilus]MEA1052054.1 efflux RND transporter periplasmic adaptor subunit [Lamprobacter modestohalophilus]